MKESNVSSQEFRKIRLTFGLTQEEFAQIIGVTQKTVSSYEEIAENYPLKTISLKPYQIEIINALQKRIENSSSESFVIGKKLKKALKNGFIKTLLLIVGIQDLDIQDLDTINFGERK